MKHIVALVAGFGFSLTSIAAQEWKISLRNVELAEEVLDTPDGYRIINAPSFEAPVIMTVEGPTEVTISKWLEIGGERYYLTREQSDLLRDGAMPQWIFIPGTGRSEFIRRTTPAKLIKRETRDFFGFGYAQTAEIFEETVSLAPLTRWGPDYRRAEVDFRVPVKVKEFRRNSDDSWEVSFVVFPAFESSTTRVPGVDREIHADVLTTLITKPRERKVTLTGPANGEELSDLFITGTVWAATISEGRVQALRLGYHGVQPPFEISRLSPPEFISGREMRFRFAVSRLLADPVVIEVNPDRVAGLDFTMYDAIAELGGAKMDLRDAQIQEAMHDEWNVTLSSDLTVRVLAPMTSGRGGAAMVELESLGLGPSFEEELKALVEMKKSREVPSLPPAGTGDWSSVLDDPLGFVPAGQRDPETPAK